MSYSNMLLSRSNSCLSSSVCVCMYSWETDTIWLPAATNSSSWPGDVSTGYLERLTVFPDEVVVILLVPGQMLVVHIMLLPLHIKCTVFILICSQKHAFSSIYTCSWGETQKKKDNGCSDKCHAAFLPCFYIIWHFTDGLVIISSHLLHLWIKMYIHLQTLDKLSCAKFRWKAAFRLCSEVGSKVLFYPAVQVECMRASEGLGTNY